MAYTPINWDELTPINLANLNKMDNAIDSNDNKLDNIDSNGDGKVDNAVNADNVTSTYKGNDIDTDGDGTVDNADNLSGNTLTQIQNMFYPVGSIYTNAAVSTNPSTLLGFGTWVKFGEGKVLVSQDGTDADFNVLGETGGSKTHTLTENEMPSHNHTVYGGNNYDVTTTNYGITSIQNDSVRTKVTTSAGGDAAHNNVQPYIVVYMWKRTA